MFLNIFFKLSPSIFLHSYTIAVPNSIPSGHEYVNLAEVNNYCCIVELNQSYSIFALYAQCLIPEVDKENIVELDRSVDYFFTSEMSGCQFLIYKSANGTIYVEHNNFFHNKANYERHYYQVLNSNPTVIYAIHQSEVSTTEYGIEYPIAETRCIVGVRNGDKWTFYVKSERQINQIEIQY